MEKFSPPSCMNFTGNVDQQWQKWKNELSYYLISTGKDTKSYRIKFGILLSCIGTKGREIYDTFTWPNNADGSAADRMVYANVVTKFDDYCSPRKNITYLRYLFFTQKQKEGQSFDDFVTLIKNSNNC